MSNKKLNTHYYDGKIEIKNIPELEYMKIATIEYKKEIINKLYNEIKDKITITAKNNLSILCQSIGTNKNYDPTNDINADDLLCLCYDHIHQTEFVNLMIEQLNDMSNGFCAQGRTHRLLQILLPFI